MSRPAGTHQVAIPVQVRLYELQWKSMVGANDCSLCSSFALQLESETSGQVRMWRLPPSDAQRKRCVKAATENIKKRFFTSPEQSLEVLEVYKIENRVLLSNFQRFTTSLAQTTADIKMKGLFCSVPAESVERCVAYGMHASPSGEEPRFVDSQGRKPRSSIVLCTYQA